MSPAQLSSAWGAGLVLALLCQDGGSASSSNASASKAPPRTATISSHQHRAGADPTVPALSGSDPAPLGALSEQPVLFAGYHIHLASNCSFPPPFYQPSVASAFHGSFTDVTADLLCKIFPPIYLCLCFIVMVFFCISFCLILFKYLSIHLSFTNASINNEMKELSNIIPGY